MLRFSFITHLIVFLCLSYSSTAQETISHETAGPSTKVREDIVLSDSTIQNITKGKLARLVYESIVQEQNSKSDKHSIPDERLAQYQQIERLKGKRIAHIRILPLQTWGPDFSDTTKVEDNKALNALGKLNKPTRTRTISRSVFINTGDVLDPEKVLDNERILRTLPFIRDAQIIAYPSPSDTNEVNLTIMTKDVFPYGLDGSYSSLTKWSAAIYNKNMFGQGHELKTSLIHNGNETPNNGYQIEYAITNLAGTYADLDLGYTEDYAQQGFYAELDRPFLRTDTKWGGSTKFYRYWKSNNFYDSPYDLEGAAMNYSSFDSWFGYAFDLPNNGNLGDRQLVIAGRYRELDFYERPPAGDDGNQYYANSNLILGSLSLAKRYYIRDNLINGFGTTEDMPKGYFHELVVGYDNNEFLQRWYAHLFLSSGNLIKYRSSYLYVSAGIGSFFNSRKTEQGETNVHINYISKQLYFLKQDMRYSFNLSYLNGINRFDQEYITINDEYGIHGFSSQEVKGQKKLALSSEAIFYLKRKVLGFNISAFSLLDLGIIGYKQQSVFTQDYYVGFGGGIRIRNDQLVFGTIQIRLTCYPKHPADQSLFGFQFSEENQSVPYNFQPRMPQPLEYR